MAMPPFSSAQAERIQHGLDTAQRFGSGKNIILQWSTNQGGTLTSFGLACVLTAFEIQLWGFAWYSSIGGELARALLWFPVVAVIVNGWIFWRLLDLETPHEVRPRAWARAAGTMLAAVPLAGTIVLPLWRTLGTLRPHWAFLPRNAVESLLAGQVRPTGRTVQRAQDARLALISSFYFGLGALIALGVGLGRFGELRLSLPVIAGFGALHLAGFAVDFVTARNADQTSGRRRLGPWLWLMPAPCHILGFFWSRSPRESLRAAGGLITSTFNERTVQRRSREKRSFLALLYGPARSMFSRWYWRRFVEPLPPLVGSRAQAKDRELVRCKMFLLFFDGFLILAATYLAAGWILGLILYLASYAVFLVSTLVAVTVWLTPVTQNALGLNAPPHREHLKRAASVLWLSQVAFISGQQVAYSLILAHDIWLGVGFVSIVGSVMILIVGLLSRRGQILWFWCVLYLLIGAAFIQVDLDKSKIGAMECMLVVFSCLAPIGHLLLVRTFSDWLLWPVSSRSASDLRLPDNIRRRTRLAALALTLPFGGLLTPLWSFVRPPLIQATARAWWAMQREEANPAVRSHIVTPKALSGP